MPEDENEFMYSDDRVEEDVMDFEHETETDVLKNESKSFKMKATSSREVKSLKIQKEKTMSNIQKTPKTKDTKKAKPEMTVELKNNSKFKTKDAVKSKSNVNHDQESNEGVHDMSSSPSIMEDDYECDGYDETTQMKGTGVKTDSVKDKLFTTKSGEIIRRDGYKIPKISRYY